MTSSSAENYLRQIYLLGERRHSELVPMGELADALGVVPGTATSMVKKLAGQRLVVYEPYAGVRLSKKGLRIALSLIRRHRLIEVFLVEHLGLDWSEIHEEAGRLEHAMSERILDRIDDLLGHPGTDPHGDPIPDANGSIRSDTTRELSDCARGERLRVVRVLDQDPDFLNFIAASGLRPGARIGIEDVDRPGDAISVRVGGSRVITLGSGAARKLLVERAQ